MKRFFSLGFLMAGSWFLTSSDGAEAGIWCWRNSYSANQDYSANQELPPAIFYRHEYSRYTAPVSGPSDLVIGPGPSNYANTPIPYYYSGGFAPGGFTPNYEYSGGNGGYRLDVFAPRPRGGLAVTPFWTWPGPIP